MSNAARMGDTHMPNAPRMRDTHMSNAPRMGIRICPMRRAVRRMHIGARARARTSPVGAPYGKCISAHARMRIRKCPMRRAHTHGAALSRKSFGTTMSMGAAPATKCGCPVDPSHSKYRCHVTATTPFTDAQMRPSMDALGAGCLSASAGTSRKRRGHSAEPQRGQCGTTRARRAARRTVEPAVCEQVRDERLLRGEVADARHDRLKPLVRARRRPLQVLHHFQLQLEHLLTAPPTHTRTPKRHSGS